MIKRLSKKVLGFCYKYFLKAVILKNGVIFKEGNFKILAKIFRFFYVTSWINVFTTTARVSFLIKLQAY